MAQRLRLVLHVLLAFAAPVLSDDYISWQDARGGVVRDTLYLEGGLLWQILAAGVYGDDAAGLAQFNFGTKFDTTSNFTELFRPRSQNFSDPGSKNHTNGFMIADNDEWYAFGGRAYKSYDNHTSLTGIIRDAIYQPNSAAVTARTGLTLNPDYMPDGNSTNRYITNGAGVSIPTESLGFYVGGMRTPNGSEISWNAPANASAAPSQLVDTMLMVDTHKYGISEWSELPLPDYVVSRADAVVVWVPVGKRGSLVLIGGVLSPGCDLSKYSQASQNANAQSLMSTVSVYDIASATWHSQPTNGDSPPQLAQACGVVASTDSMHNIYVYGGYDGMLSDSAASDDVWILSLPSFTWIQAKDGNTTHGRYSHVCARPYPDQMMVVGGISKCNTPLQTPAFADVFNMTSLSWTGSYDPSKWSEYAVPSLVTQKTQASPIASMSTELAALFNTAYAGNLTSSKWYPYTTVITNPTPSHKKWLIPVIVVIAVLAVAGAAAIVWFCCLKKRDGSTTRSSRSGRRSFIHTWMHGQPQQTKSVRSDDDTTQVECVEADGYFKRMPQTEVAELMGNSDSRLNSPSLSTPLHSPRGPVSPGSPGSAELGSPPARHELPASFVPNNNIQAHPLFPHPISGIASSVQSPRSVSSPSTEPMTPFELPLNRSDEDILASPDDLDLNKSRSQRTNATTSRTPKFPQIKPVPLSGDVSPDFSAATSPDIAPTRVPITPPSQPIRPETHRSTNQHQRNTSSLSSGLPDLSSPSPREDTRRSMHIAGLPNSPDLANTRVRTSEITVSSNPEASSDADPKPSSPQRSGEVLPISPVRRSEVDRQIRRKEIQNWAPGRSAYRENEDMYGNGRDTV